MRALVAVLLVVLTGAALVSCSDGPQPRPYATQGAKIGEALAVLGWNVSASQAGGQHAKADTLRFGLYGALAHPIESTALGSCSSVTNLNLQPAVSPTPDKHSGTVCLGPQRDHHRRTVDDR